MQNFADITPPIALSPLDGRYRSKIAGLTNYLSEPALNRARIDIEIRWLIYLTDRHILPHTPALGEAEKEYLHGITQSFGKEEMRELKELERETKHDVKAVEYFLKRRLDAAGEGPLAQMREIIHLFCTSEDINNLAYALSVKSAMLKIWLPAAQDLIARLRRLAQATADCPMPARTHGQNATPTTVGKEISVFIYRLCRQLRNLERAEYLGKFNGATGTFGAHAVSLPEVDWIGVSRDFVSSLGLTWNPLTTQIEPHDWMAEIFSSVAHFNRIAHNLATDFWMYISFGYFRQLPSAQGTTGSSTMPHKINPIRFENAEANLEISNTLLDTLSVTLVTSRMQRDLTDSSTLRNIGIGLGYSLLALRNLTQGLEGVAVSREKTGRDLAQSWEVLAEPIQQVMRVAAIGGRDDLKNSYEKLKELTRGHSVTQKQIRDFIGKLNLPEKIAKRLENLTPETYTGLAGELTRFALGPNNTDTPETETGGRGHGRSNPPTADMPAAGGKTEK